MSKDKVEGKIIEGHEYDGIQELDNPLPRWWLGTFYITIIFSALYVLYYHIGDGPSIEKEYQRAQTQFEYSQYQKSQNQPKKTEDEAALLALVKDPNHLRSGKAVYDLRCASCHGDVGQGLIGPNLTDSYWIHGDGKIIAVLQNIRDGVPDKGMPPWGPILKDQELKDVSAYVMSLKGTNPSNPKAPQGEKY